MCLSWSRWPERRQVTNDASSDHGQELIFIGFHSDQDNLETRLHRIFENKSCGKPTGLKGADDEDITSWFEYLLNRQKMLRSWRTDAVLFEVCASG